MVIDYPHALATWFQDATTVTGGHHGVLSIVLNTRRLCVCVCVLKLAAGKSTERSLKVCRTDKNRDPGQ